MQLMISFRKAEQDDIAFLLHLRKVTMDGYLEAANVDTSEAYHLARITECFQDSNIILCNGQIIGLVKLGNLDKSIHIRQLQILPDFQQQGIGAKVLALVKRRADQLLLPVTLNVLQGNPALSLYLRNGYQISHSNDFEHQMISPLQY